MSTATGTRNEEDHVPVVDIRHSRIGRRHHRLVVGAIFLANFNLAERAGEVHVRFVDLVALLETLNLDIHSDRNAIVKFGASLDENFGFHVVLISIQFGIVAIDHAHPLLHIAADTGLDRHHVVGGCGTGQCDSRRRHSAQ